jgi:hypothetical protein
MRTTRTPDWLYDCGYVYDVYPAQDDRCWDVWFHGGPGDGGPLETMISTLSDAICYALYDYEAGGIRLHIPTPEGM